MFLCTNAIDGLSSKELILLVYSILIKFSVKIVNLACPSELTTIYELSATGLYGNNSYFKFET